MEKALPCLNRDDIRLLHPKLQLARAEPGQLLAREGHPPPGLFIVRDGSVLVKRTINGFMTTAAVLRSGEMFGEAAFICPGHPASATVIADSETDVILLAPRRIQPLLDENPGLAGRFHHSIALTLSRRLRAYNAQPAARVSDRFGQLPHWELL